MSCNVIFCRCLPMKKFHNHLNYSSVTTVWTSINPTERDVLLVVYKGRFSIHGMWLCNRRFPRSMRSQGERPGCGSHVKRVDHGDAFNAWRDVQKMLTVHYFMFKFDLSWGIRTKMGKTEGIFLNLQCDCHRVASMFIKLINLYTNFSTLLPNVTALWINGVSLNSLAHTFFYRTHRPNK